MVAFGEDISRRSILNFKWFGILDLPFDEFTWEHAKEEEEESIEEVIEEVVDEIVAFRNTVEKLRNDGWRLLFDWDDDGGRYFVTHSRYENAMEANKRLVMLEVKGLVCFDVDELRSFFK